MRRLLTPPRPARRAIPVAAALLATLVLLVGTGPALAEVARPTVDPAAPTPTSPPAGLPAQGSAPDGSTVGGPAMATREVVTAPGTPPLPAGIDAHGWLVADPVTLGYLQTRTAQLPDVPGHPGFQIQTQDTLLTGYPGTLGGKTGFTDAARHTFVVAAERGGRRLVVSLMQAERRPVPDLV